MNRAGGRYAISVGPFCRKGLRSPAATCDQMSFHFEIMSSEITAPLFVSPRNIPLTVRLAAIWKILSGRKDLQKSPKRSLLQLLSPFGTRRSSTTGFLEQMPRSKDRQASARRALIAARQPRSTPKFTPRNSYAFAKSKPY